MAKPKEWVLNIAFNRWQLNRPKYVGKLAEAIRECAPKTLEEWERWYYERVRPEGEMLGRDMREHLEEVARRLYAKISEQLRAEIATITEDDCFRYVWDVVIRRTFEGYQTEKKTVYEQLQQILGVELRPAPDEWDRRYQVDFYIEIGDKALGIQIKPITYRQTPELHKWREWMRRSHERFEREKGGKVFIVFSITEKGGRKQIYNVGIVSEIMTEVERLNKAFGP